MAFFKNLPVESTEGNFIVVRMWVVAFSFKFLIWYHPVLYTVIQDGQNIGQ